MTSANRTYPLISTARAPMRRPGFVKTMIAFIEAFQEALDMRRAAHSKGFLSDE
jgi:hypothetical protein